MNLQIISYLCSQNMETAKPWVSFILTYYNLPVQMLCECIDSIRALSLTPQEREIIVIDDGSELCPMNALMHYGDELIYVRQKNQGLSAARNTGIGMATGQYLQFVDADDHLLHSAYEYCLDIIRMGANVDMVLFDFTTKSTESQTTFNNQFYVSGSQYMLSQNIHGTACGYLFRRTTLGELRFTAGIYHEDEEFTPQLLIRAEKICVTNAKAYYYYKRPGSITTNADEAKKKKRLDDSLGVLTRLRELCDHVAQDDRTALKRRIAQLTMDYIYQTIIQQRSSRALDKRIEQLRQEGFFPLPDQNYSQKYTWFRRMTNNTLGRRLLLHTLPLLSKER